jgi:nicotinamidase-related amidase
MTVRSSDAGNARAAYDPARTALLMVDPYNDFMTEGGKLFGAIKDIADGNGMFDHMRRIMAAVRAAGIQVFIVPHHRHHDGDFDNWMHVCLVQQQAIDIKAFAKDSWGGTFNEEFGPKQGDVVIYEHMAQNGFANTNLDVQLKQHNIDKLILIGMIANSCIESTGRMGMELGYHVTLVKDATSAFSADAMHAAHAVNGPAYAHAILTTAELLALLPRTVAA